MRGDIFKMVFLICFVAGCLVRAFSIRGIRKNTAASDHTPRLEWLLLLAVFFGMQIIPLVYIFSDWLDFADYHLPAWAGVTGAILFVPALWLLRRSHADLGLNFSPRIQIKEEHSLVTKGVYSRIRHPMYAAHWLWAVGQALLLHNWIAGPAFLMTFLPVYLLRAPREEKMMLERFGEEYSRYMERTGRVVPPFRK